MGNPYAGHQVPTAAKALSSWPALLNCSELRLRRWRRAAAFLGGRFGGAIRRRLAGCYWPRGFAVSNCSVKRVT